MKKFLVLVAVAILAVSVLAGCGSAAAYKDGDYTAKSEPDERGNWGEISINVTDGKIANVDFKEFVKGGAEKDENYGKGGDEANYEKAQNALAGAAEYGPKLVETQDVEKVDVVSGATHSNELFKTLANEALESAKN